MRVTVLFWWIFAHVLSLTLSDSLLHLVFLSFVCAGGLGRLLDDLIADKMDRVATEGRTLWRCLVCEKLLRDGGVNGRVGGSGFESGIFTVQML